ncbi:gamma-glutamylcyclotransferase [Stenotrophomonas maltophilia]|uniref:gamma-glutamylcyclotransferase n=1 Tax=Stenotrophomonas maltophilia TaxID=40324 RepID=UPI001F3A2CBA|nr:gamma-glutamylcyclotransferase [Stenotrophomonas maltophilia]MCF3468850.1 hypothetical protein [Stenotrophomonas maltophilia]
MNTLNRDELSSGAYLESFGGLPEGVCLSAEQLGESLDLMLAGRPLPEQGVWVFAYGSLIWNPTMGFNDRQQATLNGWERSFCLHLIAGRVIWPPENGRHEAVSGGSPELPGVVVRRVVAQRRV